MADSSIRLFIRERVVKQRPPQQMPFVMHATGRSAEARVRKSLQQQFPPGPERFIDALLLEPLPCISAITEIELFCWKPATEKDLEVLHNFTNDALVIELDQSIKIKTADIRKQFLFRLGYRLSAVG